MIETGYAAGLAALLYLQFKHYIFDYVLQTPYQYLNKGTYGHPGGFLHATLHAAGTVPVFLILPSTLGLAVAIVLAEFVVHYHIDWSKEQLLRRGRLTPDTAGYWRLHGFDQFIHQATYIGIIAIFV